MNSIYKIISHTVWHCHYHIVFTPKYRYKVLTGIIKEAVERTVRIVVDQLKYEIV